MSDAHPAIYCFSGTGNTWFVARRIAEAMREGGRSVELVRLEDALRGGVPPHDPSALLGIGYPVHAWNAPSIVFSFLARLPAASGGRAFLFRTAGDQMWRGGSTMPVRAALARRGYRVFHEQFYVMRSNFGVRYPDELSKQLAEFAGRRAGPMAAEIAAGRERLEPNGALVGLVSRMISAAEHVGAGHMGRTLLRATEACTRCGLCVRRCPTGNIRIVRGAVRFGWACVFCMRCIYGCPSNAVTVRGAPWLAVRAWRDLDALVRDPGVRDEYVTAETRGYYARMRSYFAGE